MKKTRVCVIGLGAMGRLHLEKLSKRDDVDLIASEIDRKKADEVRRIFHLPVHKDYKDIKEKFNAAIIATPTESHYGIAEYLLKRRIHVFVEKPLASSENQARKLCELAAKKALVLQVGHIERFNPAYRKIKKIAGRVRFLEFIRMSPFPSRGTDVDVVMDVMIHDIDLALDIVRSKVKSVESFGRRVVSKDIDIAIARIVFRNGCVVNLTANRVYTHKVRNMEVISSEGYFIVDLLNRSVSRIFAKEKGVKRSLLKVGRADMIEAELLDFLKSVRGFKKPEVSGRDGFRALKVAGMIQRNLVRF